MSHLPDFLKTRSFHFSLIGAIALALIGVNVAAFSYFNETTVLFTGPPIDYDDPDAEGARAYGAVLCENIVEEGLVLLKNENNSLPLKDKKINIFGFGGSDKGLIYQGGGSSKTSEYEKTSLFDSFIKAGLEPNPELHDYYSSCPFTRNVNSTRQEYQFRVYESSLSEIGVDRIEDAFDYSKNAVYVISRPATEKLDLPLVQYDRYGKPVDNSCILHLSQEESELLDYLKAKFDNLIVVLNCANPFEVSFATDERIDSIIQMGFPGNTGSIALGKVLSGEVSPSGRLVDTFAHDITSNPAYANSSTQGSHNYADHSDARYVDYAESIYVGYRYYETYAKEYGLSDEEYRNIVAYPFGYGLSYTDFSWDIESLTVSYDDKIVPFREGMDIPSNAIIHIGVWVENTGNRSGKDVIEIYGEPPYKQGGIEKSSANLLAYAKTVDLSPGKGEAITFSIPLRDFSSYDCFDMNKNGFMGEELEAGLYSFSLRKDAHYDHPLRNRDSSKFSFSLLSDARFLQDNRTKEEKKNLFTTYKNASSSAESFIAETESPIAYSIDGNDLNQNIDYLSRAEMKESFPMITPARKLSDEAYSYNFKAHSPKVNPEDQHPSFGKAKGLSITDGFGKDFDDPIYDELVSQCRKDELIYMSIHAGFETPGLSSIGKPHCVDLDGPCGINTSVLANDPGNATSYPCASLLAQTWNHELCYAFGEAIAKEANAVGLNGWYAPAANIHRSPLSGRNFEYYSEDPLVCGKCATYVCLGAIEGGVYCYLKHFVADENESGTNSQYHWLTEQALREIYAKPFEIAVKNARVNAIMTSKNRVGSVRCSGSDALLQTLLRKEWGFHGTVITDYYVYAPTNDSDEAIRAGCDLMLEGNDPTNFDDTTSATFEIALARAAKNVIYTYCDTMHRSNLAQDRSFDHYTGSKKPYNYSWVYGIVGLDIGMLLLLGGYFILVKKKLGSSYRPNAAE